MSLDLALLLDGTPVYSTRLTATVEPLARAAGLYAALWCPGAIGAQRAGVLAEDLRKGLRALKATPQRVCDLDPVNGLHLYAVLVDTVTAYLAACQAHPQAQVVVRSS